jgi:hypothetical protein
MNVPLVADTKLSTVSVAPGKPDATWIGATDGDVFSTLGRLKNGSERSVEIGRIE